VTATELVESLADGETVELRRVGFYAELTVRRVIELDDRPDGLGGSRLHQHVRKIATLSIARRCRADLLGLKAAQAVAELRGPQASDAPADGADP
jgi:hypothetical protein